MHTYLRHGVHLCLVDEGAVFLDLSSNAYLGIDTATKRALTTSLVGLCVERAGENAGPSAGKDAPVPQSVAALLQRGLLTGAESLGRAFCPLAISMTHAVPFGTGRANTSLNALHLIRFLRAWLRASMLIRRGRLLQLTSTLSTLKASLPSSSDVAKLPDPVTLVHIARRLATLFYSSSHACLLDSMVLAEFLIRHGHRPTLIFGVRTKPFLAHAWVQLGTLVLNDSIEHAQTLTPIAAL